MPVGEALQRLATMHEREVAKMRERFAARVPRHDSVQHSAPEKLVTFRQGNEPVWTARAEPLAHLVADMGILRWWWHGRIGPIRSRLDSIVAEGQQFGVEELVESAASVDSLQTAELVCELGAYLAGAEGLLRLQQGDDWDFFALYDAPGARITIQAPPMSSAPPPATRAAVSLPPPPATPLSTLSPLAPLAPVPSREPARELVAPVGVEAMQVVRGALPRGFQQALLTVVIDLQAGKARLFLHLAATDLAGDIAAPDPSQRLFDAVVAMIAEHRRRGGADLHKLLLRLRPSERGASLDLTVS
jgi:hypothetical protein